MGMTATTTRRVRMASNRQQVELTYEELRQQHQDHERRLQELNQKAWLTPAEELESKQLKKLKLRLKDQMENLRRTAS
jgi:hypothetical protein